MKDVAALAGVSDRTVSNVLSGKVPVRAAKRTAVLCAVDELGYQMNVFARSLRTRRTGFITLAIPDLRDDYLAQLTYDVLEEARQVGLTVIVQQTGSQRERELAILTGADRQLSDGLIFQPHALGTEDQDIVITSQPMVLLGGRVLGAPVPHVAMANVAPARAATEHLLTLGRRRIAVIGATRSDAFTTGATLRLQGYTEALQAAGLDLVEELITYVDHWDPDTAATAARGLLDRGVAFDGLFCFNDTLARGALPVLRRHGLRIPQDVAVVGFDNVPAAAHTDPPLTTIDSGGAQIAREAVQRLVNLIDDNDADVAAQQEVVAGYHLVRRQSA